MTLRILANPGARRQIAREVAGHDGIPRDFHRRLPGYAPTPLVDAPALAEALGVSLVLVKDESARLGLPSYKVLGASWAIYRELVDVFDLDPHAWSDLPDLAARLAPYGPLRLVAATDGNHGRAVARMARLLGLAATIYVPLGMVPARAEGIASEGADVVEVDGSYDDAVARSAQDASDRVLVISDTSWPGYERVPRRVIDGYATIFAEVAEQAAQRGLPQPTVVAAQIGVGALAAAAITAYRSGEAYATLVGVEPADAACMLESVRAGRMAEVPGPHRSIMAGLNCGLPSPLAFSLVQQGMDALVAVGDDEARRAMRVLAEVGVESGESGAAGLAGLLTAVRAGRGREVGLRPDSVVLLVSTEGATDPAAYREIVGRSPRTALTVPG